MAIDPARAGADLPSDAASWPRSAAVVGVGLMGTGIAQLLALSGIETAIADENAEKAGAGRERAINLATEFSAAGLMSREAPDLIADHVTVARSIDEAAEDAVFLVEAVTESPHVKREVYRRVESVIAEEAVIATNTSAIPIHELGAALRRPERFVGTHWFNPPQWIPCVEVIAGPRTSRDVVARVSALLLRLGKRPVTVGDRAGFVANRIQLAMFKEAASIVAEGIASAGAVDDVVRNSFGFRLPFLGPFMIADLAGLDVYAGAYAALEADLGARFAAPQALLDLVAAGHLGAKTDGGFSTLDEPEAAELIRRRDAFYGALARLLKELDDASNAAAAPVNRHTSS
jgi:3-hydroxybutyryl-CoA dehydrogenase